MTPLAGVASAAGAHGAADRCLCRDPALPPLRHRSRHQPHARLWRADAAARAARTRRRPCCSGTALGRGSAWATAGATLVVAVGVPPAARASAGRGRPPLQPGALRRAAADGGLPRGPARRTRRARGDRVACSASVLVRPAAGAPFFLPESGVLRRRARRAGGCARPGAGDGSPSSAAGQPLGVVLHDPRASPVPARCSRRSSKRAAWRSRSRGCGSSFAASSREVEDSRARIVAAGNEERRRHRA